MSGHTHQKKHNKRTGFNAKSSELVYADKDAGQEYAEIIGPKGNCRFEARIISTGVTVNVPLRGNLTHGKTKQLIAKDDIVLLVPNVGDGYIVDSKYRPEEVKVLRKAGELTQIVETTQASGVTVAFGNEAVAAKRENIEIDDDVIANL
jgi:hypothetical protein